MAFRIAALRTRITHNALQEARIVVSPLGRHDCSRYLVVSLESDDGTMGYGEAATTPAWSGETAESAQCLTETLFAPKLVGATFDHPSEVAALLERLSFGNPFTRGTIDTAAWDLWARARNVPAVSLFCDREPRTWIPSRASVGCYDVAQTESIAADFHAAGIRTLKFKIGVPGFDDAARLRAVRERLGSDVRFTVDANGGYPSAAEAIAAIAALEPFGLDLVEQPTPRDRISMLAEVRRRVNIPIMADESVFTVDHLREAIDLDACDIVSLYPGKNGGVSRVIEMARMAQEAGLKCAIGSNLETELGQAAMIALAAGLSAFPVDELACDLAGALYYRESSIKSPLPMRDGGVLLPTEPGFSAEPNWAGEA